MTPMQDYAGFVDSDLSRARPEGRSATMFVRLCRLYHSIKNLIAGIKRYLPRIGIDTPPQDHWLDNAATAISRRFPNCEHQEHFLA